MEVSVATPEKILFKGKADDILLTTEIGQINVLPRHTNIISFVRPGTLRLKGSGTNESFEIGEGVLKVYQDKVTILCQEGSPS